MAFESSGSNLNEFITVTVFPCGKEDGSHMSNKDEVPYEITMQKKSKSILI